MRFFSTFVCTYNLFDAVGRGGKKGKEKTTKGKAASSTLGLCLLLLGNHFLLWLWQQQFFSGYYSSVSFFFFFSFWLDPPPPQESSAFGWGHFDYLRAFVCSQSMPYCANLSPSLVNRYVEEIMGDGGKNDVKSPGNS